MVKVYEAIIEIPMGTKNKYEIDKKNDRIKLDRVLYSPMTYPAEYGYLEHTLAEDNDPLDISGDMPMSIEDFEKGFE